MVGVSEGLGGGEYGNVDILQEIRHPAFTPGELFFFSLCAFLAEI